MTPSSTDALLRWAPLLAIAWLVWVNLSAFRAFADDKRRAVAGQRRIPEHRLLHLAMIGGAIGALAGQRLLRHKTRKQPFAGNLRAIAIGWALALLALAAALLFATPAAASYACANPTHHDGDAIRCAGASRSDRLYGIDAPEMPGACRPGRACTPGDPYAARDTLAAITAGRAVTCEQVDADNYGRRVVRCSAGGTDLSCAMVASGQAVQRYGNLSCGGGGRRGGGRTTDITVAAAPVPAELPIGASTRAAPVPERRATVPDRRPAAPEPRYYAATTPEPAATPAWPWAVAWLVAINLAAWLAFARHEALAFDRLRGKSRGVPRPLLLGLAALGGSPAALAAGTRTSEAALRFPLFLIAALQLGIVLGLALL